MDADGAAEVQPAPAVNAIGAALIGCEVDNATAIMSAAVA